MVEEWDGIFPGDINPYFVFRVPDFPFHGARRTDTGNEIIVFLRGLLLRQHQRRFKMRVNYAIIFVSNMKRSVSFYRDVLGFSLKFESSEWTEFASEGATVALHASEVPNPDQSNRKQTTAGRCRPGLSVPELDVFHKKLVEKGVTCIQEPKEIFGVRIAQYLDPDGLAISVSEERNGS